MKKLIFVCLTVLLCGMLMLSVSAAGADGLPDGHFANSDALFQYWNSTYPPQYPDYVSGVWTDNGTSYPLTIALTDDAAGRAGKKEILRLIADDGSVKFTTMEYSYNQLWKIREEIMPYFEKGIGLVSLGVFDMENHVGVEIHTDYRDSAATQDFIRDLKRQYGNMVNITYAGGYVALTGEIEELPVEIDILRRKEQESGLWIVCTTAIGLLGTAAVILTYRHRHVAAAQTAAGAVTLEGTRRPSRRALKQLLRESEEEPPSDLEKRVMDTIDRE